MYDILISFLSTSVVAFISTCAPLSYFALRSKILCAYPWTGHVSYEDVLLTWVVSYTRWTQRLRANLTLCLGSASARGAYYEAIAKVTLFIFNFLLASIIQAILSLWPLSLTHHLWPLSLTHHLWPLSLTHHLWPLSLTHHLWPLSLTHHLWPLSLTHLL